MLLLLEKEKSWHFLTAEGVEEKTYKTYKTKNTIILIEHSHQKQ